MPQFTLRYGCVMPQKAMQEAPNVEAAAKQLRQSLGEDGGEVDIYEIGDANGEPLWDSDGNTTFDIPQSCSECGQDYPEDAETLVGGFHKATCSLYSSTENF